MQKEASELRNNLREVEKARLEARRELQELRRQVSDREMKGEGRGNQGRRRKRRRGEAGR